MSICGVHLVILLLHNLLIWYKSINEIKVKPPKKIRTSGMLKFAQWVVQMYQLYTYMYIIISLVDSDTYKKIVYVVQIQHVR